MSFPSNPRDHFEALITPFSKQLDQHWPDISTRLWGLYYWGSWQRYQEGHAVLSFEAFIHLSDRQLLQIRNLGKRTLQDIRRLSPKAYSLWDDWAATLPVAWHCHATHLQVAVIRDGPLTGGEDRR